MTHSQAATITAPNTQSDAEREAWNLRHRDERTTTVPSPRIRLWGLTPLR